MSASRYLVISAKEVAVSVIKPTRNVGMHLDLDQNSTGLIGVDVVIEMTPTEARKIAQALIRKADAAEEGLPRA